TPGTSSTRGRRTDRSTRSASMSCLRSACPTGRWRRTSTVWFEASSRSTPSPDVRLTRRQFVAGGAGALTAAGVYGLVDRFTGAPQRTHRILPSEQHALGRLETVVDNGVEVV